MLPRCLLTLLFAFPLSSLAAEAQPGQPTASSATLPLSEVLRLHQALEQAREKPKPDAPLDATITRLVLDGRLLDDAVELTAHFELAVLGKGRWIQIPLLVRDATTHLAELPSVPNAEFVVRDDSLWFVTDACGRYAFDLKLLKSARVRGQQRAADLIFHGASLALMNLRYDEGLFALAGGRALSGSEGRVLFPDDKRFSIRWTRLATAEPTQVLAAKRPPTESVITSAQASSVATLEGLRITRVRYALRFEGTKPIQVGIPDGLALTKVYLNGAAIPFTTEQGKLSLDVTPERAGDQAAVLELVLTQRKAGFHLSGELAFAFPATSWNVNEFSVEVHLPKVFNYRWAGGSLEPAEGAPAAEFTHRIPTPGKRLAFRQQLVGRAPDVRVGYTVDLAGQFWRGGAARPAGSRNTEPQPVRAAIAEPAQGQSGLAQWVVDE